MLGKHHFSVAAPLVWDSLPLDLRTANSLLEAAFGFQTVFKFWALLWTVHSLWIHILITLLITVITICKHFDIFVHPLPMKLRILWSVLLLVHDSITVTLCSTKRLTKTSTNCSEFRIVLHELSVESVDGNKMLGSYVTTSTGYLFTL